MKRIFTLLALVMVTVFAMAETRTYKGTWVSKPGDFANYEGSVVVSQDASGRYTLVFDRVVFDNDDLGRLTFAGIEDIAWAGNGGLEFSQEGGNLVMNSTYFELGNYDGKSTITDDEFHVTFRYFSYNGTERRNVYFDGKRTSSGGGDPDEPTISSTEQFTATVASLLNGNDNDVFTDDVTANLCEWTDGSYSINLSSVNTEQGTLQGLTFKGLTKQEDGENILYLGTVTPEIETLPAYYQSFQNLQASVYAIVNEDGDLLASISLTDADDPTFELIIRYGVDADEPAEPVVVAGTLSGYTKTDDGEFTNSASSVLTLTEAGNNTCTATLTNVVLPSATISLGTVTIEGVAVEGTETENGASVTLTKNGGECTTTAEHPSYSTVDLTSFEASVVVEDDEDDNTVVKSCTAKLVIDNYGETITYTFAFDPTATTVRNIVAADGTVKRVYTLTGASVNAMQRGLNIVRTADGKTVKVLKK